MEVSKCTQTQTNFSPRCLSCSTDSLSGPLSMEGRRASIRSHHAMSRRWRCVSRSAESWWVCGERMASDELFLWGAVTKRSSQAVPTDRPPRPPPHESQERLSTEESSTRGVKTAPGIHMMRSPDAKRHSLTNVTLKRVTTDCERAGWEKTRHRV